MYMVPKQAATGRDPDVADHQIVEGGGKGFFQLPTTINMSIHFLLTLKMLWVALCPPWCVSKCIHFHTMHHHFSLVHQSAIKCQATYGDMPPLPRYQPIPSTIKDANRCRYVERGIPEEITSYALQANELPLLTLN